MASASIGRQDMFAGVLTETRNMVRQLDGRVDSVIDLLEVTRRETQTWRKITDQRLDHLEEDIVEINGGITKLNDKYDGLKKAVTELNTKYERLDGKVDALGRAHKALDGKVVALGGRVAAVEVKVDALEVKVDALDRKVDVLTEEVGGLKAGQIELRDMVATLLARSEGIGHPN
ncbi:MAG TPA: hypothetical protein VFU43_05275 [Streptosporangiaceae bacterium]|nr:hypothetical protein [Streptosporangiaceae bacterium]